MEHTRFFFKTALLVQLLVALASAQLIVQPGYGQQRYAIQSSQPSYMVPSSQPSYMVPSSQPSYVVSSSQPSYAVQSSQPTYAVQSSQPRYGFVGIPMYQSHFIHEGSSPSSPSLAYEIQRNQALQEMVQSQLRMADARQAHQTQNPTIPRHLLHYPVHHRIGSGKFFTLTPSGLRGLSIRRYGYSKRPYHLFREAGDPQMESGAEWPRSVSGDGNFGGDSKIYDVASVSPVGTAAALGGVDESRVPQALVPDELTGKSVEPRHVGSRDDAIVGSPLSKIHYDLPYDYEQHHPMDSSVSSQFMKAAHSVGEVIDKVAPGLMDPGNESKDSMMTSHQDARGNYVQRSGYNQQPSLQGEAGDSSSDWKTLDASSTNQPISGQVRDNQQVQNSGWSSILPDQSWEKPSAKASTNGHFSQEKATYSDSTSPVSNWLTAAKNAFGNQPSYQNYQQPGYHNQPYQNYQYPSQVGGYRPNGPYGYSLPNQGSASASSASSSANSYNYYNPYQRSWYNNPYTGSNQNGFSSAVDQFGRTLLNQLPSAVNSLVSNPNTMNYLRNVASQQIPQMIARSWGY